MTIIRFDSADDSTEGANSAQDQRLFQGAAQEPPVFSTQALSVLASNARKVLVHIDGAHGVFRRGATAQNVVDRAKMQRYLLLDLGHVVRLYFGDDYFDLYLETSTPYERAEAINALVSAVTQENSENERRQRL